jgi:hypothetical protein
MAAGWRSGSNGLSAGFRLSALEQPVWNRYYQYPVLGFDWASALECVF